MVTESGLDSFTLFRRVDFMGMQTMQIRLTENQIKRLDVMIKVGQYPSRSEAVRDATRRLIETTAKPKKNF